MARRMRCAKSRLMMIMMMTPALKKMLAAIARETLSVCVDHASRRTQAVMRAMQKPKRAPEALNLCPRRLFFWKMVICVAAAAMKRKRKTAVMGSSTLVLGTPPKPAVLDAYGPPRGRSCLNIRFRGVV